MDPNPNNGELEKKPRLPLPFFRLLIIGAGASF